MEFKKFKKGMQTQFQSMTKNENTLFLTNLKKDDIWNEYLGSFPDGTNEVYKERREFDCDACKHFVRKYGNLVAINEKNELKSIWEIDELEYPFDIVAKLKFDIVLRVLETKKSEAKDKKNEKAIKAEKDKILYIIAKKQAEALESLSEEELKKKLLELS